MIGIINYLKRNNITQKINPEKIGRFIQDGGEGYVFEYGKDKIIKFMRLNKLIFQDYDTFFTVMQYVKTHPSKMYSEVYEYGQLTYRKKTVLFYIAEKLRNRKSMVDKQLWKSRLGYLGQRGLEFVDFHDWNVMEDFSGNQKLIDMNSFVLKDY